MLIAVLHNSQEYLESLNELAIKLGIIDTTIFEKESIGSRFIGERGSLIYHKGKMVPAYDKAFMAVATEKQIRYFLDAIENDKELNRLSIEDEGFICTVPFNYIQYLELELATIAKEETKIKLADYLKEERILLDLKSSSKEEAIGELVNSLKNSEEVINLETFLKDIMEREFITSSGISDHIAIPHARTDAVKSFVIAFGRSAKGIDFYSLDNKPAKLIFLMGTPRQREKNTYLGILSHLTNFLQKEAFRQGLFEASSAKEIIEQFKKFELSQ